MNDRNWYAFSRRQNLELFEEQKILVPYMIDHLCGHWDVERHFFVNVATGGYGIMVQDGYNPMFVTALLNSRLLSWVLRCYSRSWRGGWFAARKANLIRLPIPDPDATVQSDIVEAYLACCERRRTLEATVSDQEAEMASRLLEAASSHFDSAVEQCYGISDSDLGTISLA